MGIDTSAMVALGRQQTRGEMDYVHRRRLSERVYGTSPAKSRQVSIILDGFDLTHLQWQDQANCRDTDPEAFFPLIGEGVNGTVRAICDACPVKETCLEYALGRPQLQGIWGGTSDEERKKIRKQRGIGPRRSRARHAAP